MKLLETISRYLLGLFYLIGAIDGTLYLIFDIEMGPKPDDVFFLGLLKTTYFWALMKFIQLIGSLSLLANYRPALGFALLAPITSVLFLYYLFDLKWYLMSLFLFVTSLLLLRLYSKSYRSLLDKY
jgi:putative oxidoreductase